MFKENRRKSQEINNEIKKGKVIPLQARFGPEGGTRKG